MNQHPIIKKRHIWNKAQAGPEGTSKFHKEAAQMPMVPTSSTLFSLCTPAPMASWGVPYEQLTEEWFFLVYRHQLKMNMCLVYSSFPEHPRKTVVRNLLSGQNSELCTWLFILPGRRNGQTCKSIPIDRLWPMFGHVVKDLDKDNWQIENKGIWERRMWIDLSNWAR